MSAEDEIQRFMRANQELLLQHMRQQEVDNFRMQQLDQQQHAVDEMVVGPPVSSDARGRQHQSEHLGPGFSVVEQQQHHHHERGGDGGMYPHQQEQQHHFHHEDEGHAQQQQQLFGGISSHGHDEYERERGNEHHQHEEDGGGGGGEEEVEEEEEIVLQSSEDHVAQRGESSSAMNPLDNPNFKNFIYSTYAEVYKQRVGTDHTKHRVPRHVMDEVYDRYRTQARLEGIPDSELVPRSKIQHRLFKYSKTKKGRAAIDYVEPAEARRKRREHWGPSSAELGFLSKKLSLQLRLAEGLISENEFKARVALLQAELEARYLAAATQQSTSMSSGVKLDPDLR